MMSPSPNCRVHQTIIPAIVKAINLLSKNAGSFMTEGTIRAGKIAIGTKCKNRAKIVDEASRLKAKPLKRHK